MRNEAEGGGVFGVLLVLIGVVFGAGVYAGYLVHQFLVVHLESGVVAKALSLCAASVVAGLLVFGLSLLVDVIANKEERRGQLR